MPTLLRKILTLSRFSVHQWFWLVPFYILSGLFRAIVLTLPFRYLAPFLGHHNENAELAVICSPQQEQRARELGTIIRLLDRYTLWQSNCLVQAMLSRLVLSIYRIPHAVYLGVCADQEGDAGLKAHAWVNTGRYFISGGNGHREFTVVSCFVSEPDLLTSTRHVA